jgi:hypothetical protein
LESGNASASLASDLDEPGFNPGETRLARGNGQREVFQAQSWRKIEEAAASRDHRFDHCPRGRLVSRDRSMVSNRAVPTEG